MTSVSFFAPLVFVIAAAIGLQSCATMRFYTQAASGQLELLAKRQPLAELTLDPETPEGLRRRLREVEQLRRFAVESLGLPGNGSYQSYVDLKRPFVVWNVFAAPEFSLTPLRWCFPFVGCVSYRGYFAEEGARRFAHSLQAQGYDVFVGGVVAYSTLGWFADPVLNTMLRLDDLRLAKVIFHELAHQKLYIPDDTAFNEAYATKVAQVGVERWLKSQGREQASIEFQREERRELEFVALVLETRKQLESLYASPLNVSAMRAAKERIFQDMRRSYRAIKRQWDGYDKYDAWMAAGLNNAKIASVLTYHERIAGFEALLKAANDELERYYVLVRLIGQLPSPKRTSCLEGLAQQGPGFLGACFGLGAAPQPVRSPPR